MRVRFWGTRGSIAKPGPQTTRYGGNTSCVELRSAAGTLIIIDCGTGAHELGKMLVETEPKPLRGHMLISHTHWDHIQGWPFLLRSSFRGMSGTFMRHAVSASPFEKCSPVRCNTHTFRCS